MKVILKKKVDKLGISGDIVNVSEGYARNYLIPRDLGMIADEKNVKALNHQKKVIQSHINSQRKEAEILAEKISALSCTISKKVGEEEKLFGSVTTADIEEALVKEGFTISKKDIVIAEPIKALGVYTVLVKVAPGVESNLKVWVVEG